MILQREASTREMSLRASWGSSPVLFHVAHHPRVPSAARRSQDRLIGPEVAEHDRTHPAAVLMRHGTGPPRLLVGHSP